MCSFITQHNATDVASFEGACNWHADCRNFHQSFIYNICDLSQVQGVRDAPDEPRPTTASSAVSSPSENHSKRPRMEDLS